MYLILFRVQYPGTYTHCKMNVSVVMFDIYPGTYTHCKMNVSVVMFDILASPPYAVHPL